jgi:hypothetical protein
MAFLLYVIGVILIIEGVPWFLSPEKLKSWFSQLIEAPEETLRGIGFGMMIFGLLLVYMSKQMGLS